MYINRYRISVSLLIVAMMATGAWAKGHVVTAAELLAKSDALYFSPSAHGITDLAMDITVDTLQADPVGKMAKIGYFYHGEQNQWVEVNQIPEDQDALRQSILDEVTPVERFIMPTTASETFADMSLEVIPEARLMAGVSETSFYWVKGTAKKGSPLKAGDPKIFQVLLDRRGRLYEISAVSARNERMTGSITDIQLADGYHIALLKTRYLTVDSTVLWVFEKITYGAVGDVMLPSSVSVEYRDNNNQPAKGHSAITLTFSNYRLNKGVASAELSRLAQLNTPTQQPEIAPPMPSPLPTPMLLK